MINYKQFLAIVVLFLLNVSLIKTQSFGQVKQITINSEDLNELFFAPRTIGFGLVEESEETIEVVFQIMNTNKKSLTINSITASCGCISPSWNKEPLPSNGGEEVKLRINIKGRKGAFIKSITFSTNFGTRTIEVRGYID